MEFIQMKGLTLPIACAAILGGLLMPSRTQARAHEEVTVEDLDLLHQNIRQATQRILQLGQSINDVGAYADLVGRQTRPVTHCIGVSFCIPARLATYLIGVRSYVIYALAQLQYALCSLSYILME